MPTAPTTATISAKDRRRLLSLTRKVADGLDAADERAALYLALRQAGHSFEQIAEATGVHKEAVRKAVLRRTKDGYGPDGP